MKSEPALDCEERIVNALQDWKADSDKRFNWPGGKPQRVLTLPASAVMLDQSRENAYVTVEALIAAFMKAK